MVRLQLSFPVELQEALTPEVLSDENMKILLPLVGFGASGIQVALTSLVCRSAKAAREVFENPRYHVPIRMRFLKDYHATRRRAQLELLENHSSPDPALAKSSGNTLLNSELDQMCKGLSKSEARRLASGWLTRTWPVMCTPSSTLSEAAVMSPLISARPRSTRRLRT